MTGSDTMIGQTLSHYRILEELGEGGMGVLFRALDARLDRTVAIKLLRPEAVGDADRRRRFVQEAKAASALNHSNIVVIHEIDQAPVDGREVDFIAMEYVDGRPLDGVMAQGPLAVTEAIDYAIEVTKALAAAHGAGIVHRDVKPANIMVSRGGHIKVLDPPRPDTGIPFRPNAVVATKTPSGESECVATRSR